MKYASFNGLRAILPVFVLALSAIVMSGCFSTRTWDPENPPKPEGDGEFVKRIVLFAPVDATPLLLDYPDANLDFARDLAKRIDVLAQGVEAWVGETLPVSSSVQWKQGPVGGAAGAHLIVLTEIKEIRLPTNLGTPGNPAQIDAVAVMRAFDADGNEVWAKQLNGSAANASSPKMMTDAAKPVSRAAWDALSDGSWALKAYLDSRPSLRTNPDTTAPELTQSTLIEVTIDSIPGNADIFIDDIFRGNTPAVVPLPVRKLNVRIERQGYRAWERELTPSPEMRIQPALEPLGGYTPAADALPRPTETPAPAANDGAVIEPNKNIQPAVEATPAVSEPDTLAREPVPAEAEVEVIELPEVE